MEVAKLAHSRRDFGYAVVEFLDQFRIDRDPAMLAVEPPLLRERLGDDGLGDAYLAAVAVHLSCSLRVAAPAWTASPERFLHHPWFASPGAALRATLLLESPAAFRERNLFVSENALERA